MSSFIHLRQEQLENLITAYYSALSLVCQSSDNPTVASVGHRSVPKHFTGVATIRVPKEQCSILEETLLRTVYFIFRYVSVSLTAVEPRW